jgi:multiple sugar transport system ATP-binding protein
MTLGQRVAVMHDGRILQVDVPQRLYEQPRSLFVAGFIGSPAMNLVDARIEGDQVSFGEFRVPLDPGRRPAGSDGRTVVLGIRPESFEDAALVSRELPTIDVGVVVLEELGSDAYVFFHVETPRIVPEALEAEGEADARLVDEDRALLNARVDPRTEARVGGSLRVAVDPTRFHFFDPDTGASLLESVARPAPDPIALAR